MMRLSTEIYTRKVKESRDFYINNFNFEIKKQAEGFVVLQHKTSPAYELLFCIPGSPFVNKLFHPEFSGKGIIFQMEIDNAEAGYHRVKTLKIPIVLELVTEPVNGTHFTIQDPNGILIDIVQYS